MLAFFTRWRWPALIGMVAWCAVAATRSGPGITSDEPFNVIYGIDFVSRVTERGRQFFTPESIDETFFMRKEHPPLGRWAIGLMHWLMRGNPREGEYGVQDILDSRLAPAAAFALTLVLLTRFGGAWFGPMAGVVAGVSLLVMPHSFGHAHIAALDTFVGLTYLAAAGSALWMMEHRRPWLVAPIAGAIFGLCLLTKIHGFFLPAVVGIWALGMYRFRSMVPLFIWFVAGIVVFFAGWQWLWHDLVQAFAGVAGGATGESHFPRLSSFLGSSVERAAIFVPYWGRVYRDTEVPWHYPWVMFGLSVPAGIHLLAILGVYHHIRSSRSSAAGWLCLAAVLVPVVAFSVPGVPVYDGIRLYLMVFPLWAVFSGLGGRVVFEWCRHRWGTPWAGLALALFLTAQSIGVMTYHPFQLSYYNLLIGGLRGAERLGFEVTYWGDAVTTDLIERWSVVAPENSCALLVPSLYDKQADLYQSSGTLRKRQQVVDRPHWECPYVVVYNRRAYLDSVRDLIADRRYRPLFENSVDGVWLARVYVRPRKAEAGPRVD